MEKHTPVMHGTRMVCSCGDFNCASLVTVCVGCFNKVAKPSDHAKGCPTGQNGSPNYN